MALEVVGICVEDWQHEMANVHVSVSKHSFLEGADGVDHAVV